MTSSLALEPLAVSGEFADDELVVIDLLAARVRDAAGVLLGPARVDTETPDWGEQIPEFIRVSSQPGRGGVSQSGTAVCSVLIECYGPTRRAVKALATQVTDLMLGLDRGGAWAGVLVDACYNAAGDAPEDDRDDDDRRRSSLWGLEWRRHFRPTVMPIAADVVAADPASA